MLEHDGAPMNRHVLAVAMIVLAGCATLSAAAPPLPDGAAIDAEAARAMAASGAQGMAVAVIDEGQVVYVNAYGRRNAANDPLRTDTIMYGASLTKAAFAYMAMQLVEEGVIDLDTTIDHYLPRPLPDYTDPSAEDLYAMGRSRG